MTDFKKSARFSRDNKPGGFKGGGFSRPSFGGGPRRTGGRDEGRPTETFSATCSKCNSACEVPFRPNGKKPVFCRNCFVRDDERPSTYEKRSYGSNEKRSYGSDRPVAAAPAFDDSRIIALQKELAIVHAKLDTLIQNLEGAAYAAILSTSNEREEKPKRVTKKKA